MAWGKPWPRHSGKMYKTEITDDNNAGFDEYAGSVDDEDALFEESHVARPVFNHVDRFLPIYLKSHPYSNTRASQTSSDLNTV